MQDLFQRADGAHPYSLTARQLRMVGFGAPMPSLPGGFFGPSQRGAKHDGVSPTGHRLDKVSGAAHPTIGNDMDVASAGFIEVVAAGGCHIGDRGGHGGMDAQ